MQGTYYKEWSSTLNREMEFKVYGTGGVPVLALPCGGSRFYDWEDHGMLDAVAWLLDNQKIQLFCADVLPQDLWASANSSRRRAELQEKYFIYLTRELAPRIRALNAPSAPAKDAAEATPFPGIWCAGTDLGAYQALNLRLRRPDLFSGAICLAGLYDPSRQIGSAQDDLALRNTPLAYLSAGLPGCTQRDLLNAQGRILLCAGQGSSEAESLSSTRQLQGALWAAGIPEQTEIWGQDVSHDWYWWAKEWNIFAERFFH